jgi:DNA polymerase I-like protein with 3'-5' exonuclease and polymerase domains
MLTVTNGGKHDWANMPLDEMAIGCAMDCDFTLRFWRILRKEMHKKHLHHVYDNLLKEIALELAGVENFGITVDTDYLAVLEVKLTKEIGILEKELQELSPIDDININSNVDLQNILFTGDEGLNLYPVTFTKKTKKPSVTDADLQLILEEIEATLVG